MKKKELINEIMGVPRALTPWINTFTNIIIEHIEHEIKSGWYATGDVEYVHPKTNEKVVEQVNKSEDVIIHGHEIMILMTNYGGHDSLKDFLDSESFINLPLWRPTLEFVVTTLPDVLYDEHQNMISAKYDRDIDQKLSRIGKKMVLPNTEFGFNIVIPKSGITRRFRADLRSTISHELLHAYQTYKQLESGGESHFGKETTLNSLVNIPIMRDMGISMWDDFLNFVYLHLSFEINARIPQLYEYYKELGINTKEEFLKNVKKSDVWRQMKYLENFNAKDFIDNFELPKEEEMGFSMNPLDLVHKMLNGDFSKLEKLKHRGVNVESNEAALKSLINMWDNLLQMGSQQIKNDTGIDFNMLPVPEKAKQDPYLFFKFFEDRFKKKAEKWKRKIYRVGSLLIQDGENT